VDYFNLLFQHVPGGTEEIHDKLSHNHRLIVEIQTRDIQNTKHDCQHYPTTVLLTGVGYRIAARESHRLARLTLWS
jgi:hypothetical protein